VDEVLSVGDVSFQKKTMGKIHEVSGQGRTVLFVSHNMAAINHLCETGIVLDHGRMTFHGLTADAVDHYLTQIAVQSNEANNPYIFDMEQQADVGCRFKSLTLLNQDNEPVTLIQQHEDFSLHLDFTIVEKGYYFHRLFLRDSYGNVIFGTSNDEQEDSPLQHLGPGEYSYHICMPGKLLKPGEYSLSLLLGRRPHGILKQIDGILNFEIGDNESRRAMRKFYYKEAIVAPEIPWYLSSV
jgi:lipopolysaccharide transport system ATP-binding protein